MTQPRPSKDSVRAFMKAQPDAPRRPLMLRVIRRCFRELMAPLVWLMYLGHRFGRVLLRTEFEVRGGCKKRGACCHHVLMEWSPWLDRFPWLGRMVLWKLTRFYSFFDRGYTWEVQEGLMVRVLGCHALKPSGECGEYRLRPLFCRTYPEVPLAGSPLVLKGCGYRFGRRGEAEAPELGLIQLGNSTYQRPSRSNTGVSIASVPSEGRGGGAGGAPGRDDDCG